MRNPPSVAYNTIGTFSPFYENDTFFDAREYRLTMNTSQQVAKVFWTDDSIARPKLFIGFALTISHNCALTLLELTLVIYQVHHILLNFSDEYKRWPARSEHSMMFSSR